MKKLAALFFCIVAVCALSSCSNDNGSSSDNELSSIPEVQTFEEESRSELDYNTIAADVGPILHTASWENPTEIPIEELLKWYVRYISGEHAVDPEYMSKYRVEDSDALHIPAGEFEDAAAQFFGLEAETLQKSDSYYADEQAYTIAAEGEDTAAVSCNVTRVTIGGAEVVIYFDLVADEAEPVIGMLTVEKSSDGIRFVSCVPVESDELEEEPGESVSTEIEGDVSQVEPTSDENQED